MFEKFKICFLKLLLFACTCYVMHFKCRSSRGKNLKKYIKKFRTLKKKLPFFITLLFFN